MAKGRRSMKRRPENMPGLSQDRIRRALAGGIAIDDFSGAESRAYFAQLGQAMQEPTAAERIFYASIAASVDAPGILADELFGGPACRGDEAAVD